MLEPRLWRELATADSVLVPIAGADAEAKAQLTDWETVCGSTETWKKENKDSFGKDIANLVRFRAVVPQVARALANVATYMIFDDHEVTDDWNLNQRWRNRVYSQPFGRGRHAQRRDGLRRLPGLGQRPQGVLERRDERRGNARPQPRSRSTETGEGVRAATGPYPALGAQLGRLDELAGAAGAEAKQPTLELPACRARATWSSCSTRARGASSTARACAADLLGHDAERAGARRPVTDGRELLVVVSPAPVLGPHAHATRSASRCCRRSRTSRDRVHERVMDPPRPVRGRPAGSSGAGEVRRRGLGRARGPRSRSCSSASRRTRAP